ncbi:MAG TPA: carbohydrate ABC transporter permease [Terrimicrobiaceae bacterium]|nr:carbohydrate ABC transporter permease [Terrimicrobiaceae bacterium]
MFFSPVAEKSFKVRSLYAACYLLLCVGAATILAPLLIMATGSVTPSLTQKIRFIPGYLANDTAFWRDYLASKYNQSIPNLRMAWGDPAATAEFAELPAAYDGEKVALWERFLAETGWQDAAQSCGFFGTARLPQYNQRNFRRWLLARHGGGLDAVNRALGTGFPSRNAIIAPNMTVNGPNFEMTPLAREFFVFLRESVPDSQRITMNCGGYYRAVFLPQVLGRDVSAFNQKYGTHHASYAEVPFPATVPAVAADQWHFFVSRILRPNLVDFTESGSARFQESGLPRDVFIRQRARPEDLRVRSLDVRFTEWAAERGHSLIAIPQKDIDCHSFHREKSRWRAVFLTQNYAVVVDEILLHGRAATNTLVLVILSVAGTLIVNPMAAYALSRYRPKLTYQVILFCLLTVALPGEVTMIPIFLQLKEWGLLNTFGALVLPGLANGFSIFLLKGFFDSLPRDLYDAAEIDGASEATIFWLITMNLSRPILAVLALGAFTSAYGTFMYALILCPDPKMWTLMVYMFQLMQNVNPPILYAALILISIPTILIFVFCQNIILRGIVVPAEK